MPIYEYKCEKCKEVFEAFQSFSDEPLKKCNKCSGKVHKIVSQSSFHLKGTGWYVTDYAGKSGSKSGSKAKKEDSTETKSISDSKITENKTKATD
jgi:putative FmdB family regulatory protein